jgi:hypothetical protein
VYTFEFSCKDNISLRTIRHRVPSLYSYATVSFLRFSVRRVQCPSRFAQLEASVTFYVQATHARTTARPPDVYISFVRILLFFFSADFRGRKSSSGCFCEFKETSSVRDCARTRYSESFSFVKYPIRSVNKFHHIRVHKKKK